MTVQEFKEKFPHLAHLEGNELWDAMSLAVVKPYERQEGDEEIIDTVHIGDLTFDISKGAKRAFDELMKDAKPLEFKNFGFLIPGKLPTNDKT